MANANQANNGGGAPTSPLIELIKLFTGGKAKPAASSPAAAEPAASASPSPEAPTPGSLPASAAGAKPTLPPGPLVTVITRNEFYRDGFRNLIKIAVLEALIIVGLILTLIVYMNSAKSFDRYFATTADGRIMQLVPLDRPNMTTAALMSWVAQAATEVMTFGFHDYQRRLQQSSRHFTKRGWESFTVALQKAGIVDSVTTQQQVVTATPRSAPVLVQQGVLGGKYRWIIQMPLQVTYRNGAQTRTDNLKLNLVIERVPSLENPNGVGIEQWVAL